jgi:hypothetical protein
MAGLKTVLGTIGDSIAEALSRAGRTRAPMTGGAPIVGLPQAPLAVGGQPFIPSASPAIREAAESYMRGAGLPYVPVQNYVPVDVPRARAIAQAFEVMPHAPGDPAVQRSYEALAKETRDQYLALKRLGVKFEPYPAGQDPYGATPRLAMKDLLENKRMYYFPSDVGFGLPGQMSAAELAANPMMKGSGIRIGGKEVPYNDLFRIVHDVFGHAKEGVGFRAAGEENAWRSHGRMYSPQALPAMTAETRGQNSWVNFGPFAEQNLGASAANTVYAPQKAGMLPQWVIDAGRMSPLGVAGVAVGGRTLADMAADNGR